MTTNASGTRNFCVAIFLMTIGLILSACGGGSGGGSSAPTFLVVSSTNPGNGATDVDARIESIEIRFASKVDPLGFVNEKAALSQIFQGTTETDKIVIRDNKTKAAVSAGSISLADLKTGNYSAVRKNNDGSELLLIIDNYFYSKESNGSYGLTLDLRGTDDDIYVPATRLINSGLVNSNLVKVQAGDSLETEYGQVVVDNDVIRFYPVNYLRWETKYTVTVDKSVKDATYGKTLKENYVSTFKTVKLPEPAISSVNPIGSFANPIKKIYVSPNFMVTDVLGAGNIIINEVSRVSSDDPSPVKLPIGFSAKYNAGTKAIEITPASDLKYAQEYEVTIKSGLKGNLGNYPVQLKTDYVWTFTTASPSVVGHTPDGANPDTANVERESSISIAFNYRPNGNEISSSVSLVDLSNNTVVAYAVESNSEGKIVLRPSQILKYGTKYTVVIRPTLTSAQAATIRLDKEYSFSFTTVQRVILSTSPENNQGGVDEGAAILVKFNFDVADGQWEDLSKFAVEQSVNGVSWKSVSGSKTFGYVDSRTLEFLPRDVLLQNASVRVTIGAGLLATDGKPVFNPQQITFKIRNKALSIVSTQPKNLATNVPLNSEISVRLSYSIDPDSVRASALSVRDCYSHDVRGKTTVYDNELYFLPSETLRSNCSYQVTVDSGVKGKLNEVQESTQSWKFTTDYLRVEGVYVDYAYDDLVDVYSTIKATFNYSLGYVYSSDVSLVNVDTGGTVSGTVYSSGRQLEFYPYQPLDYGTEYRFVIRSSVVGYNGESLTADDTTLFVTQNLPVDIYDYGPTGVVYTDDVFWLELSESVYTRGFPYVTGSIQESGGYSSGSSLTSSDRMLYLTPYGLSNGSEYKINFKFDYPGYNDDFDFYWTVFTENSLTTYSSRETAQSLRKSSSVTGSTKVNAERSCRNNSKCRGQIKTRSKSEYAKVLASRTRGNIKMAKAQQKVRAQKARAKRTAGPRVK